MKRQQQRQQMYPINIWSVCGEKERCQRDCAYGSALDRQLFWARDRGSITPIFYLRALPNNAQPYSTDRSLDGKSPKGSEIQASHLSVHQYSMYDAPKNRIFAQ